MSSQSRKDLPSLSAIRLVSVLMSCSRSMEVCKFVCRARRQEKSRSRPISPFRFSQNQLSVLSCKSSIAEFFSKKRVDAEQEKEGKSVDEAGGREGAAWMEEVGFLAWYIRYIKLLIESICLSTGEKHRKRTERSRKEKKVLHEGRGRLMFSAIIFSLDSDRVFRYPTKETKDKEVFVFI